MRFFQRKSKAKDKAQDSENVHEEQSVPTPTQASYTTLEEALREETVDDTIAREHIFYKPGGNIIVSTIGSTVKFAFRIARVDFNSRFKWSDQIESSFTTIRSDLNGYDITHLYSATEDEATKTVFAKIFRAYAVAILQNLEEDYENVKRVKTEIQAEGEPTEIIEAMDFLNLDAKALNVTPDATRATDIEHVLGFDRANKQDIQLHLQNEEFTPRTGEEHLVSVIAQRELSVADLLESSDFFVWADLMEAVHSLFLEHVLGFTYPNQEISSDELREQLLYVPEPEPEPEPIVEESVVEETTPEESASEKVDDTPQDDDSPLSAEHDGMDGETVVESVDTTVEETDVIHYEDIRSEDHSQEDHTESSQTDEEGVHSFPVPLPPVVREQLEDTNTPEQPPIDEDNNLEERDLAGLDTEVLPTVEHDEADDHDTQDALREFMETTEASVEHHEYYDDLVHEPLYAATMHHIKNQSDGVSPYDVEDEAQDFDDDASLHAILDHDAEHGTLEATPPQHTGQDDFVLPEIDLEHDTLASDQASKRTAPTAYEEAQSILRDIQKKNAGGKTPPDSQSSDNGRVEPSHEKTPPSGSAFDLDEVMLQGKPTIENSPLFERLAKERGLDFPS